jgi:hypothetical protein
LQLPATPVFLLSRTILRSWFNVDFHLAVTPQNVVYYTIKSARYPFTAVFTAATRVGHTAADRLFTGKNPTAT